MPLALTIGQVLGNELYGLSPFHPTIVAAAVAALGISALGASLFPVFRVSSISPLEALRGMNDADRSAFVSISDGCINLWF